ncbi:MAG: DsbA family protein [Rhodospirillaceae bacterium]|nr:DsbA family protein [Rhodospirillaceae bacterium]
MMTTLDKELIYVGDPMCSWCYGFAPTKRKLEEQCAGRAVTSLVVGGLHTDWTEPQDAERKKFLDEHWHEIGERSGQPFKFDILERDDFVYNTEASCRAAVTAREIKGNATALNFFTHVQSAFYAENQDVTEDEVLIDLAEGFGLDRGEFATLFSSDEMKQQTQMDFQFAQRLGVSGFPTVVVNDKNGYAYLTVGYQPYENLEPIIEAWLSNQLERDQTAAE